MLPLYLCVPTQLATSLIFPSLPATQSHHSYISSGFCAEMGQCCIIHQQQNHNWVNRVKLVYSHPLGRVLMSLLRKEKHSLIIWSLNIKILFSFAQRITPRHLSSDESSNARLELVLHPQQWKENKTPKKISTVSMLPALSDALLCLLFYWCEMFCDLYCNTGYLNTNIINNFETASHCN